MFYFPAYPDWASEGSLYFLVAASLNLLSLYHDTIIAKLVERDPKYKPLIPPSLHARYTRAWADSSARYKWAARALEVVRFTQLLIEMGLRRKASPQTRWRGIVVLEAIKYVESWLSASQYLYPI